MTSVKSNLLVALCACSFLISCTADRVTLDTPEHKAQLEKDYAQTQDLALPQSLELSIDDALQRGLDANLDARVSALETLSKEDDIDLARLQALPQMQIQASRLGRNNEGASSSRSLLTGNQSLEPSYSTERFRTTTEMSLSWNMLDSMLAVAQTRIAKDEALIARERHDKVLQNIQRDIYNAYWRAKAYQDTKIRTENLIQQTQNHLDKIDLAKRQKLLSATQAASLKNGFSQQYQSLTSLHNDLSLAEIELKSLLSLPQNTALTLVSEADTNQAEIDRMLGADLASLEEEALLNRPEMRETYLQKNIDRQNIRNEILKTLPGAELFFASNRDTNQFLADSDWLSYSASLTQNLISLFTLPARKRAAENIETLGDARRVSLTAAVLTQVHLSRHRLQTALDEYEDAKLGSEIGLELARADSVRHTEGLSSLSNSLPAILQGQAERIRALQAEAEIQDALGSLYNSLGRNIYGAKGGMT